MAGHFLAAAVVPGRAMAAALYRDLDQPGPQEAARGRGADPPRRGPVAAHLADGPEHNAVAVCRFRAEQVALARALAALNSQASEHDWLLIVPTSELDLVLAMRPLVIRIAPTTEASRRRSSSCCRRSSRSPATRRATCFPPSCSTPWA